MTDRLQLAVTGLVCLLLCAQVPIFLQQMLTPDAVMYDLQARALLEGGVLYRDIVEPNLPGIVWIHAAVRSVGGWSPVALRAFDLCVVMAACWLLVRLALPVHRSDQSHVVRRSTSDRRLMLLILLIFYLGTSEWCHCQRDVWMLLPALGAVRLRWRWLNRTHASASGWIRSDWWPGFLEGLVWAAAFWLKPFIAVPALTVIASSFVFAGSRDRFVRNVSGVLAGGITAGTIGIAWMIANGCWPWFVETMTDWNGQYFQSGRERWTLSRLIAQAVHFQPWVLLHMPAGWIAVRTVALVIGQRRTSARCSSTPVQETKQGTDVPRLPQAMAAMLGALYLGWMLQACLLQQLFDYVHVPGILLAMVICGSSLNSMSRSSSRTFGVLAAAAFLFVAVLGSPLIRRDRLTHWPTCMRVISGGDLPPDVKDAISQIPLPRWTELQPLLAHVAALNPSNRSVLAQSCYLIHAYPELKLTPPTRYVYLDVLARLFPDRREEMTAAVDSCGAEWVIADLVECGWEESVPDGELLPSTMTEQQRQLFPWNQTPVFRSGSYVLLRLDQPAGELSRESMPLSRVLANP